MSDNVLFIVVSFVLSHLGEYFVHFILSYIFLFVNNSRPHFFKKVKKVSFVSPPTLAYIMLQGVQNNHGHAKKSASRLENTPSSLFLKNQKDLKERFG